MKIAKMPGFKKGAASFYIVAFSTLVLVVMAASFAMTVIAEAARTSNDELSQSAYDSALAGVEDAKMAYSNYVRCIESGAEASSSKPKEPVSKTENGDSDDGSDVTCGDIIWWMQHPDCDMVAHMLGHEGGEVIVGEQDANTNQAYTCVKINTTLADYRSTLTSASQVRIVKAHFDNGVKASEIGAVKFSWYSNRSDIEYRYKNIIKSDSSSGGWRPVFRSAFQEDVAVPPVVELRLVQTTGGFKLSELYDMTRNGQTDRATAFLVPADVKDAAKISNDYGVGLWKDDSGKNILSADLFAKTNDRTTTNKPFVVYCDNGTSEFACSVEIKLPEPIGGNRNDDTFMFVVALPYGQPDTDFAMEFICKDGTACYNMSSGDSTVATGTAGVVGVADAQISIDSTGRANDLYRRVETRFETMDVSSPFIYYAVQVLGDDSEPLSKDITTTTEYDFILP